MLGLQKGFTAIEVILVVVAVAALGFAGGTWWQANQDSQTFIREQSGTDNENKDEKEKEEQAPIVFKATELEPGDKVGTMEAISVEKFREEVQGEQQELGDDNVSAKFNGNVSVKGTYVKRSGVIEGPCLENLADSAKDQLPRTEGDRRDHFCFDNESEVESKLSGQEGQEVTVTIGDYHYKGYPSEVVNSARFVEVE
jgi:prepilin-type N-terminal cleavage/methylation domain-containing protein